MSSRRAGYHCEALALLLGLLAVGCTSHPAATNSGTGASCVTFDNEVIDSIAWRGDGGELAIATYDFGSGDGVIRVVRFPGLTPAVELHRSPDVLSAHGLAPVQGGYTWIEHANGGVNIVANTGNGREVIGYVPAQLSSLRARGGTLFAVHEGLDGKIVRIETGGPNLQVMPITDGDGIVESFDVSPDGRIVYFYSHGPGTASSIVVVDGGTTKTLTPTGHLIGRPTFGANPDEVYFEDHDFGALRAINIVTGAERTVLGRDVSVVAVSPTGLIAHTYVAPTETDELCVELSVDGATPRSEI